jgi:hypothetical protein
VSEGEEAGMMFPTEENFDLEKPASEKKPKVSILKGFKKKNAES